MNEKYNKTNAFCYELFNISILEYESFYDIYYYYYHDNSKDLKDEIITNVSTLTVKQFQAYAEYVKGEIKEAHLDNPYETYVDKWIKDLNLNIVDFPFFNNPQILNYLNKVYSCFKLKKEAQKARFMQKDFFQYASLIEARKLLKLLDSLIPDTINNSDDYNPVFISPQGFQIFNKLLDFLNIKDTTTHGNKAKLAAIWQTKSSNELIFKGSASKKEYFYYLNKIFKSNFKTRSFSKGDIYESIINKWISELKK